jgi:hypothetical protein
MDTIVIQKAEPQTLAQVPFKILEETLRQLRSTRNDIIRFGVWNVRNLTDDEFNRTDDRKLLGYFRQDLLETRFLSKGRRIDLIQLWHWFDDQMTGLRPMLIDNQEVSSTFRTRTSRRCASASPRFRRSCRRCDRKDLDASPREVQAAAR